MIITVFFTFHNFRWFTLSLFALINVINYSVCVRNLHIDILDMIMLAVARGLIHILYTPGIPLIWSTRVPNFIQIKSSQEMFKYYNISNIIFFTCISAYVCCTRNSVFSISFFSTY